MCVYEYMQLRVGNIHRPTCILPIFEFLLHIGLNKCNSPDHECLDLIMVGGVSFFVLLEAVTYHQAKSVLQKEKKTQPLQDA